MIVARSRPEINLKEAVSMYEFSAVPRSLFTNTGKLLPCTDKSKLAGELEALIPEPNEDEHPDNVPFGSKCCVIDGMALVQQMGKPAHVRTGFDLATHFCNKFSQLVDQ